MDRSKEGEGNEQLSVFERVFFYLVYLSSFSFFLCKWGEWQGRCCGLWVVGWSCYALVLVFLCCFFFLLLNCVVCVLLNEIKKKDTYFVH